MKAAVGSTPPVEIDCMTRRRGSQAGNQSHVVRSRIDGQQILARAAHEMPDEEPRSGSVPTGIDRGFWSLKKPLPMPL